MAYKSELQSNNVDLQTILDTINSLPEAGSTNIETITGTIDFYLPWHKYYFYYENENGINTFDSSNSNTNRTPINFTIRKNSMVVFHCEYFASAADDTTSLYGAGLRSDVLEAANGNGIDILQNTTINLSGSTFIVDAICKVTDNFSLSWWENELQ